MTVEIRKKVNLFLNHLAEVLDISENNFEKAKQRYEAVGKWLQREESIISEFSPEIYPQGSFLLGTVIKPISDQDEYDVDLVAQLDQQKKNITQKRLKELVGHEIKEYAKANDMNSPAEEGRRCWKLQYADSAQFHMDILPAIPDDEHFKGQLMLLEISEKWTKTAIAITDNQSDNYDKTDDDWPRSNPKGYAEWFKEQMKIAAEPRRRQLVEIEKYATIEAVPAFEWKTPLQRAIQILKRHRDVKFASDDEDRPISIIISTLAAHAYDNEEDLLEALQRIVERMPLYIKEEFGVSWVRNPVNPLENFADKWAENPQRKIKFIQWLAQVKADIEAMLQSEDLDGLVEMLKPRFGKRIVEKAASISLTGTAPSIITQSKGTPPRVEISNPSKPWGSNG